MKSEVEYVYLYLRQINWKFKYETLNDAISQSNLEINFDYIYLDSCTI